MEKSVINRMVMGETFFEKMEINSIAEEVRIYLNGIMLSGDNNCEFGFDESLGFDKAVFVIPNVREISISGNLPQDLDSIMLKERDNLFEYTFDYDIGFNEKLFGKGLKVLGERGYLINLEKPETKMYE